MRKTELKNCPQWLLDAHTENEDVDFKCGILVWHGGNFWGGDFRGGDFCDGNFLGGDFRGGNFCGGDFYGGDFCGGNFRSGNFRSGNFRGGNFLSGNFLGTKISRKPITIYGLPWVVIIAQNKMAIGCQAHSLDTWKKFSDIDISKMSSDALEFWKINKTFLISVCEYESMFPVTD